MKLFNFQMAVLIWLTSTWLAKADSTVVFNEVMYHPLTNEPAMEWVELHNPMAVDVEISQWSIVGGMNYTFPEGTVVAGGGYLVVAISPASLSTVTGLTNILGPFTGRLGNNGENLQLLNRNGRVMDELNYGVEGDWPVGSDGAGPSLAKYNEDTGSGDADHWRASLELGGTPGRRNFSDNKITLLTTNLTVLDTTWKYNSSGSNLGTTWRELAFNDTAWSSAKGVFYAGLDIWAPGQVEAIPSLYNTGVGSNRLALTPGNADPHYKWIESAYTNAPPPTATVTLNHPNWLANDASSSWIGPVANGASSVTEGTYIYELAFDLTGFDPNTAQIIFQTAVDNDLTDVWLNYISLGYTNSGFTNFSRAVTNIGGCAEGINTLDFVTLNSGVSASPHGFRAKVSGTAYRYFPTNTAIATGPVTHYFRKNFTFSGNPAAAALWLRPLVDDGAVVYLNGVEVLRLNLPIGTITNTTPALTNTVNAGLLGPYALSTANLINGTNVLAIETHQATGDTAEVLFGAEISLTQTNLPPVPLPKLVFNELSNVTNAQFWVEILNYGTQTVAMANHVLARFGTTNHEYVIPAQTLQPGGRLLLDRTNLGFGADPGDQVVLYTPGKSNVLDAMVAKSYPRARWPEGTGSWLYSTQLTPGTTNVVVLDQSLVINEIMYHPRALPAVGIPYLNEVDSPYTWIELFNRSTNLVDLTGWRLAGDIDYAFPTNTLMAPGSYLVVANDLGWVQTNYPGLTAVLGPFLHQLSGGSGVVSLRDLYDNPVNRVHYYDAAPWPTLADGFGSSLELRDPRADNSRPEAWMASDEGSRSEWQYYTNQGIATVEPANSPSVWKEFVMGLLDEGEVLIDDLSVIQSPGGANRQLIQNGKFENGRAAWRFLGTHRLCDVIVDPGNAANHVLRLVSTGNTDHMHNHIETTLTNNTAITNGLEYQITFRAKWISGCPRLNTRLYFNRLARTFELKTPALGGTPGARNSRYATNLGPTYVNFQNRPLLPTINDPVTVTVTANDPDGVSSVNLRWSVNGGTWNTTNMTLQGGGLYQAVLPAYSARAVVQMYAEGTDLLGAKSTYPAGGTNARALYTVNNGVELVPGLHAIRVLMTPADAAFIHASTNVMSNEGLGCTVVYDDSEIFYDADVHLQGSERGRDNSTRVGFTVRLPAGQLLRGAHDGFTVDRSGGYSGKGGDHDEILVKHAINHAGGLPGMYDDLVQFYAPRAQDDGTGLLIMAKYGSVFLDSQYRRGGDGEMYKLELVYYPTTTSVSTNVESPKLPQPDAVLGTDIKDLGNDPEFYRWTFLKENHAARNNYLPMVALAKTFSLTGTNLDQQTQAIMDVDEWMRGVALLTLLGGTDMYTYGNSHNLIIYFRPEDNKAMLFPWDMDFSFVAATTAVFPGTGSSNTTKIINLPANFRRYYSHLLDLTTTTFKASYLTRWANHYGGLLGQNWSAAVTFLDQRATYVRSQLPLTTAFVITNNSGNNFATTNDHVTLSGTAPLTVQTIEVNGVAYPITWTSLTNWYITVALPGNVNPIRLQGVDHYGVRATNVFDTINVTNKGAPAPLPPIINEWMADNKGPGGYTDAADGLFQDWIELFNPNTNAVDISGMYLTDDPATPGKWRVPTNTFISARGFLLVWADNNTNQNPILSGTNVDLHAAFSLNNAGENIALFDRDAATPLGSIVYTSQVQNVSQGLFPDGNTNGLYLMTNWSPRGTNRLGLPPAPLLDGSVVAVFSTNFSLSFSALPGRTYSLEYKEALTTTNWLQLGTNQPATGATLNLTDDMTSRTQRYYRVKLLP
jgi:hypothetical protein